MSMTASARLCPLPAALALLLAGAHFWRAGLPALTLGCGAVGGSATSENVGPMHLLNLRYVAYGLKELDEIRATGAAVEVAEET